MKISPKLRTAFGFTALILVFVMYSCNKDTEDLSVDKSEIDNDYADKEHTENSAEKGLNPEYQEI